MLKRLLTTLALLVAMFVPLALVGCGGDAETMTVLAGSELSDLEPLIDDIARETGVRLEFTYIGTLDGAQELLAGADYDLAWFSHAKYLTLLQGGRGIIATQEKIMLSPVVLGVKTSKAREFGWLNNQNVTWEDIAAKANSGELRYGMTNPTASNSGFTALVGVAAAFSGSADALDAGEINVPQLQAFFKGQALTAGSSGWLAESYVASQATLDGMINYESVLLALNESGELQENLTLIYPREGIITADYPLMLLDGSKREQYDRLIAYLRSSEVQQEIMRTTLRRPVIPGVALDPRIPDALLVELPFPNRTEVIDNLLLSYLDEQRVPAHAFFVLDVSGSMSGDGIRDLKAAMNSLTGLDTSLTGQFSRFRAREKITIITFNDQIVQIEEFVIDDTEPDGPDMRRVRSFIEQLQADGGTAIYGALDTAYRLAAEAREADRDRYYSIVLMSDGENTDGINLGDFERRYRNYPENWRIPRTFTVIFGNADEAAMGAIADLTGGRAFDGTSGDLSFIFKQIRGYQ